jgi:hypothetical protein
LCGEAPAGLGIGIVEPPDQALRRQFRKTVAETLHPPAFLVHRDEQRRRAHRPDVAHQLLELLDAEVISRKQDGRRRPVDGPAPRGRPP